YYQRALVLRGTVELTAHQQREAQVVLDVGVLRRERQGALVVVLGRGVIGAPVAERAEREQREQGLGIELAGALQRRRGAGELALREQRQAEPGVGDVGV